MALDPLPVRLRYAARYTRGALLAADVVAGADEIEAQAREIARLKEQVIALCNWIDDGLSEGTFSHQKGMAAYLECRVPR